MKPKQGRGDGILSGIGRDEDSNTILGNNSKAATDGFDMMAMNNSWCVERQQLIHVRQLNPLYKSNCAG